MEKELSYFSAEIKEQEKAPEQIIMENLFDPFSQDWLVHSTYSSGQRDSEDKLKKILEQGILSEGFADRANRIFAKSSFKRADEEEGAKKIHIDALWPDFQSRDAISTYSKPKKKEDLIVKFWTPSVGIVFSRHKRDAQPGMANDEIVCRWRVAPRRFKFLILPAAFMQVEELKKCFDWDYLCDLAQKHFLPISDEFFNLLWPVRISAKNLQKIGIENLRSLCKEIGFEKLKEMSVEEIQKHCQIEK